MPDLATLLARMTVRVTSPDGRVRAELRGRKVAVSFASAEAYASYRDATVLAAQVSTALTSAYAAAERGRRRLVAEYTSLHVEDGPHWDPSRRRLHEERDALRASGESARGRVRVTTVGLRDWTVAVAPGTLQRMDAARFLAELAAALADAQRAHAEALYELKSAHLGRVGEPRPDPAPSR